MKQALNEAGGIAIVVIIRTVTNAGATAAGKNVIGAIRITANTAALRFIGGTVIGWLGGITGVMVFA